MSSIADLIASGKFYKAKCGCCRWVATGGPEINDAILTIDHHPNCEQLNHNVPVHYDVIDLRIAEEF